MKKRILYSLVTIGTVLVLLAFSFVTADVCASENASSGQTVPTVNSTANSSAASNKVNNTANSTVKNTNNTSKTEEKAKVQSKLPAVEKVVVSEADIDAYYAESVFVGDSIMLGFRNYSMKKTDSFLNNIQFLAAGNLSATNSLWNVSKKSVHPVYQGQKRQIWESISMMNVKRVFILLGMNDLNVSGLEGTCEKYQQLVNNIKTLRPDVEIHIISMTYTLKDAGKGKLKNDTIREFNILLQNMAKTNGWGYLDLATALADENGDLAKSYCSDGFVHQSRAAYDVWAVQIRNYARTQLDGTTLFPCTVPAVEENDEKTKETTEK